MSLSLIEELELQVIALRGNELAHCAGLVQQAIAALKSQPSGVVLPERAKNSSHLFCAGWNACLDEVARLNSSPVSAGESFQSRVMPWLLECFGETIAGDTVERNHRFLEEALELVQACGCPADEAHKLVDYVYGRPVGEKSQEVGGVMVTLAALCLAQGLDMHLAAETELARITQPAMVERIREKQKRKPAMSPLPGVYPEREAVSAGGVDERAAFDAYFCAEQGFPIGTDTTHIGAAFAPWRAWQARAALSAPSHGERVREDAGEICDSMTLGNVLCTQPKGHDGACGIAATPSAGSQKEQGE